MRLPLEQQRFLEALAVSETGRDLISLLRTIEIHYADIRNLDGVDSNVRIDALKIFREALLDKLLVLSGEQEEPDLDEHH